VGSANPIEIIGRTIGVTLSSIQRMPVQLNAMRLHNQVKTLSELQVCVFSIVV
jgi:hypothetical protein